MIKQFYMRSIVCIPTLLVLLSSCKKEVRNIKLPSSTPKLVVGCFISPQDSVITLTLTRSNPIFGTGHNNSNTIAIVPDASVHISQGIHSVLIPFNAGKQKYELAASAFSIAPGQTYSLTISTPKGESVSASCRIPASNLNSLTVEFKDTTTYHNNLTVKWKDIPNESNYYRVFGEIISVNIFTTHDTVFDPMDNDPSLFNDQGKDGYPLYSRLDGSKTEVKRLGYDIYILNIDKEYYSYQDALNHYHPEDPFSEPSPLYTNIKGGLGIFAGYQKLRMRFP